MTTTEIAPTRPSNVKRGSDFARLAREAGDAGLLDRRRGYYVLRMAINVLLLAAGGLAFVLLGDSWWQLLTAMFIVLSPLQAVLFILVHQGMMGVYLGCSFAPNHKGMPILTRDEQLDHLRKQAFCARHGISYRQCGLFTSYAQILRHLHDVGAALRHPSRLANATS